jgi:antitoxin (DNA-binding transcriptional repressor) of toxin-antitoxin stability system
MERVSAEEIEKNPNGFLMRVMAGETFEVTRNGQVFATMGPPSKDDNSTIKPPSQRK